MNVAVIGLSHQEAPIEIREMASFSEAKKIEATSMLLDLGIEEVIILSTCNRSEIYIASSTLDEDIKLVKDFYSRYFKSDKISDYIFIKRKDEAINYLYRVCSGLDSIVIGEDQILSQGWHVCSVEESQKCFHCNDLIHQTDLQNKYCRN